MSGQFENSFKSASALERATVTKSFKFGASKETSSFDLEIFIEYLIKMASDADITVRRYALESLTAITHQHPDAVKKDIELIQQAAVQLSKIIPTLIKEVDLGPFKHKVDDGIPIRKAAYALFDTLVERVPERVNAALIAEVAIKGIDDTAEECMLQSLTLIHRLSIYSPIFVISNIEPLLDSLNKHYTKHIGNVANNDKAKNIMRSVIRVIEQLHRAPESEGVTKFSDFMKEKIQDNPAAKDIFQNI